MLRVILTKRWIAPIVRFWTVWILSEREKYCFALLILNPVDVDGDTHSPIKISVHFNKQRIIFQLRPFNTQQLLYWDQTLESANVKGQLSIDWFMHTSQQYNLWNPKQILFL